LPEILQDVSPLTLTWATDQNFIEFHKQMACLPGAEVHDEADLMWFATPIKMGGFNGVVRASLKPEDVGQKVAEVTELFRQRDTPWSWGVGPTSQPLDLGERLEEHGMTVGGQELAMAADLHALKVDLPRPEGLTIVRVRDAAALDGYMHAMVTGFGPPEDFSRKWRIVFECLGLGEEVPFQHYLGLLNGEPVASSSVFYGAGVAGIYMVATVPSARGRGIGSYITVAPLLDARDLGYRAAILQATQMGSSIYRRLGFESYGNFTFYVPKK
jgi:GNAT superfamily N-acetyltransferase